MFVFTLQYKVVIEFRKQLLSKITDPNFYAGTSLFVSGRNEMNKLAH